MICNITPEAQTVEIVTSTESEEPIATAEVVNSIGPVELGPRETEIFVDTVNYDDVDMLAHLLYGEAGSDWCSDEMVFYVGSVVLNRVASEDFPDTIEEVIFQKGQYACTWDGNYDREPTERYYEIAEELLRYGSELPEDVVYQAEFKQGSGVYKKVQNMYFCYK